MSFINNKDDLLLLIKTYFISILLILSLFFLSVYIFSEKTEPQNAIINPTDSDPFSQFLKKENINSNISGDRNSYVIYANTDPVIHRIEIFLSKNRDKLTEEQLKKVEKFRSERITYLMAKKYKDIVK
jgi:hypothetical protein